jgi:hypothetical protein
MKTNKSTDKNKSTQTETETERETETEGDDGETSNENTFPINYVKYPFLILFWFVNLSCS